MGIDDPVDVDMRYGDGVLASFGDPVLLGEAVVAVWKELRQLCAESGRVRLDNNSSFRLFSEVLLVLICLLF